MTQDELINYVIQGKNIKLSPFIKINKNLCNFTKFHLNVALSSKLDEKYTSLISDEISQTISKQIMSNLLKSRKFDYYDLSKQGGSFSSSISDIKNIMNIISKNSGQGYKNLITTGMIGSLLQDMNLFITEPFSTKNILPTSVNFYKIGKILDIETWVDPFLKYNDGRIVLFKDVEINISDLNAYIKNGPSFSPVLEISFKLDINIDDSKLIFIIEDGNSESFQQFKSLQRDIKIDDILNEKN